MSVREVLQFYYQIDIDAYLGLLKEHHQATVHPSQPDAYMVEGLPFYTPKWVEDHVSILSFNYVPLSDTLLLALVNAPILIPDQALTRWLIEQDVVLEALMLDLRNR